MAALALSCGGPGSAVGQDGRRSVGERGQRAAAPSSSGLARRFAVDGAISRAGCDRKARRKVASARCAAGAAGGKEPEDLTLNRVAES